MDTYHYIHCKVWGEITYSFLNFNGDTVEGWEWIFLSNFVPHIIMDVITYPCWDYSLSILVNRAPGKMKLRSNCELTKTPHNLPSWVSYGTFFRCSEKSYHVISVYSTLETSSRIDFHIAYYHPLFRCQVGRTQEELDECSSAVGRGMCPGGLPA